MKQPALSGASPKPGLVRAIGRWSLVALTVNSVIGSGVFGLPSTVARLLGSRSVIAAVIAGAAIAIVMACYAEVASQFTEAGGPYLYARTSFGRLTGILVGWMLYLSQSTAPAANANLFVIYLGEFWPGVRQPWPRLLSLTLLVGGLTLINVLGVRQGTVLNNVFTAGKIVPLLIVIISGAAFTISHPGPPGPTAPISSGTWLKAMVLLAFAYGGFESAVAPVSEFKNSHRDVAFSLFATAAGCTAIYALIQWVVVGVLGPGGTSDRPLAEVARVTMGRQGATLVATGALVSVYGYLGSKLLGMPRVTMALAEHGDLPKVFGVVSTRTRTPWFSILIYGALVWGLAIAGSFTWNVTLSVVSRVFHYGVTCAAVIMLRRKQPGTADFRLPAGRVWAVLGIAICGLLLTQVDLSKSIILIATVAAAVLNWLWVRGRAAEAKQEGETQ